MLHLGWHPHDFLFFLTHTLCIACVRLPLDVWPMLSYWSGLSGIHLIVGDFFCASCVYFLHLELANPLLADDGHYHTPVFQPGDVNRAETDLAVCRATARPATLRIL